MIQLWCSGVRVGYKTLACVVRNFCESFVGHTVGSTCVLDLESAMMQERGDRNYSNWVAAKERKK